MKYNTGLLALAALLTSTSAHMKMVTPKPYGASTLDNSPMHADGSDFPCKQRAGVYDAQGVSNVMAVGEPQTLSFVGGATHGGGSCQVSLTTDLQPSKSSKWMVIKSIEGGCPTDSDGNVGSDAGAALGTTFQYTIPEGIAPGEYTIAWTWFNRIGNREMYMNCGPATVTGSKRKRYAPAHNPQVRRQTSFPSMYIANIAGMSTCTTDPPNGGSVNYVFPDPGPDVTAGSSRQTMNLDASCMGASGGSTTPSQPQQGGSGSASSPAASASIPNATIGGGSGTAPSGTATSPTAAAGGVFASGAAAASAAPSVATIQAGEPSAPATSAAAAPAPASTGTSGGSSSSSSSAGMPAPGTPCTNEGEYYCTSSGFSRCSSGQVSAVIGAPAGISFQCSGSSMTMVPTGGKMKRDVIRRSDSAFFEGYRE